MGGDRNPPRDTNQQIHCQNWPLGRDFQAFRGAGDADDAGLHCRGLLSVTLDAIMVWQEGRPGISWIFGFIGYLHLVDAAATDLYGHPP